MGVPSTMDLLYVTVECVPASVDFPARLSLATPTELPLQMGGPSPALPKGRESLLAVFKDVWWRSFPLEMDFWASP